MDTETTTLAPVVDFARFRAERAQRQLDFDRVPEPRPIYMGAATPRPLSDREKAHRARMVAFLEGKRSKVEGQR